MRGAATLHAFLRAGLAAGLAASLGLGGDASASTPGAHPLFDDGGTLVWHTTFAEAAQAARLEGRLIFMDMSRLVCSPCRTLASQVLPDPRVRARLQRVAVGLAVDADRPEASIDALRKRALPGEVLLPMTAFLTPEGTWITGASGALDVPGFLVHLARAEAALARRPAPSPPRSAPSLARAAPRSTAALPPPPTSAPALQPPLVRRSASAPSTTSSPRPSVAPPPPQLDTGERISCCREVNPSFFAPPRPPPLARPPPPDPARRLPETSWGKPVEPKRHAAQPRAPAPAPLSMPPASAPRTAEPRASRAGEAELERALQDALAGRTEAARTSLERVRQELSGQPAATDAERGLDAVATLSDLAQLADPRGPLATALRTNKREELRGTRWARLFPDA